jgi:hypothetical protein
VLAIVLHVQVVKPLFGLAIEVAWQPGHAIQWPTQKVAWQPGHAIQWPTQKVAWQPGHAIQWPTQKVACMSRLSSHFLRWPLYCMSRLSSHFWQMLQLLINYHFDISKFFLHLFLMIVVFPISGHLV